jgi:hypothetical protein
MIMPRKISSKPSPRRRNASRTDEPTIAAIRQVRRKMLKQAGGTIEGLRELVEREAARLRSSGDVGTRSAGRKRGRKAA